MQPKRLAFTDPESKELGEYLDKFVAAGPLELLSQDQFRDVQVLIARKIWKMRPDIAKAIQAVADPKQPPALLIENVPVDDPLPPTPTCLRPPYPSYLPSSRSHYFNAGIGLIRYGNIVPLSSLFMGDVVSDPMRMEFGTVLPRPMHRDMPIPQNTGQKLGDIALHAQRGNPHAATPLVSIDEMPSQLLERLKNTQFSFPEYPEDAAPVIQEYNGELRFHPQFKNRANIAHVDDKNAVEDFFNWANDKFSENPIALKKGDYLLIDQSRAFHGATEHNVMIPATQDRWVTHMRFDISDGIHHEGEKQGYIYRTPFDIDETALLRDIAKTTELKKGARSI